MRNYTTRELLSGIGEDDFQNFQKMFSSRRYGNKAEEKDSNPSISNDPLKHRITCTDINSGEVTILREFNSESEARDAFPHYQFAAKSHQMISLEEPWIEKEGNQTHKLTHRKIF